MNAPIDHWAEAESDRVRAGIAEIVRLSGAPPREVRRSMLPTKYQRELAAERAEAQR